MLNFTATREGYTAAIEDDEYRITVRAHYAPFASRATVAALRVFVWGEDEVNTGHLPVTRRGDDKAIDLEWDRANRQVVKNKRAVIQDAIETYEDIDFLGDLKLSFDRHAGCTCSCSPGFVARKQASVVRSSVSPAGNDVQLRVAEVYVTRKSA